MKDLAPFIIGGKIVAMPAKRSKQIPILLEVAGLFESGRIYSEPEVNAVLAAVFDDVTRLRRDLVDLRLLQRDRAGREYSLVEEVKDGQPHE